MTALWQTIMKVSASEGRHLAIIVLTGIGNGNGCPILGVFFCDNIEKFDFHDFSSYLWFISNLVATIEDGFSF